MRRDDSPRAPEIPASVTPDQLDGTVRRALRSLSKANAEATARHLVMAGRLIDEDPQLAYEHAQAAVRRAGRIDVVREAAAIAAYASGRYAEALREVRTLRRLSGIDAHRPLEADSERGLGRPERALAIVAETDPRTVDKRQWVELLLVAAGARSDLGEYEAGLMLLEDPVLASAKTPLVRYRIDSVRADLLDSLGRHAEADEARRRSPEPLSDEEDDIVVYDLVTESEDSVEADESERDVAAQGDGAAEGNPATAGGESDQDAAHDGRDGHTEQSTATEPTESTEPSQPEETNTVTATSPEEEA